MIEFHNIRLNLKGQPVLRGFDLVPLAGKLNLLVGSNGAGKSSALKVAAGLWRPDHGSVHYDGQPLGAHEKRGKRIAYLPQSPSFHARLRVFDILLFYARLEGASEAELVSALERFGLENHRKHRSAELSGGLRQRLGLAILSMSRAPVWLLDEPGLSLDPYWRQRLQSWLRTTCQSGQTVLTATHLLAEWEGQADTCYLCESGRIEAALDPGNLRDAHVRIEANAEASPELPTETSASEPGQRKDMSL